ncbi:hypothetical protein CAEBREN_23606 [Caenorhabditis brenneri]|uniref:Uncharacterized protein n=1 Tax=Caenorhabditis brenneri TaxID=135651 RepID=G0MUU2_CAEBE|nr:hypothetical protein CAEBREN_23606 [Caenorhabditis brenneri]
MAKTSSPRTKNGSGQTRGRTRGPRGAGRSGAQGNGRANGVVDDYVHTDATTSSRPKRECRNKPVRYRSVSRVESDNPSDDDFEADRTHEDEDEDEHELAVYEIESRQSSSEEPDSSEDESRPNNKGKVTADMTPEEFNERLRRSKWGHIMKERRARADKEIELEQEEMAKEYEEQRKEWEERDRKDEEERQRKAKLPKLVVNGVTLRYNEEDMRQLYEEEIAPRPKPRQWQNGKLLEPEPDPEPISWEAFLERQAEWHVRYPQLSRTPSREGSVVDSDATSGRSSPSGGVQENNLVVEESGEEGDDEDMEALLQRAQRKRPRSQRSSRSRESSTLKRNRNQSDSEPEERQEENNGEENRKRRATKSKSRTPATTSVPPSEGRSRGGSRNGSRMSVEEPALEPEEDQSNDARVKKSTTPQRSSKAKSQTPRSRESHTPVGTFVSPFEIRSREGSRNGNRKPAEKPDAEQHDEGQEENKGEEKMKTPRRATKSKSRTPMSRGSHTPVGTFVPPTEIRSRGGSRGGSRMSVQQPDAEPTEDQEENAREKNERTYQRASKAKSQTPSNRGRVTPNGASVRLSEGRSRRGSRVPVEEARHEFEHEDQEAHIQESDFEFEYPVDGPSHPPETNDEEFAVPEAVWEEEVVSELRRKSTQTLNGRSYASPEVALGAVHNQPGPSPRESSEARRGRQRFIQGLLSTNRVEHLEVRVAPPRRTRDDSYFDHLRESMPLETAMKQNSRATEKYLRARMAAEEDEAFSQNLRSSSSSKRKGQPQQEVRSAKSRKRRQEPPSPADQDNSPPQVHSQSPPRQQLTAPRTSARQEEKCQYRIDQPLAPAPQSRSISVARTVKEEPVPDQDVVADDRDVERIADPGYKTRDVILPESGNKDWNRWSTVDLASWIRKVLDGDPDVEDFCQKISQEKYRGHGFFNLLLNKDNTARNGIPEGWVCELRARAEVVKLHWEDMKNWERRNKRKH